MLWIKGVFTLITEGVGAYRDQKKYESELKNIERSGELRIKSALIDSSIKVTEQGQNASISLDQLSMKQRGWKDEYLLILFTAPYVLLFIAPLVDLWMFRDIYKPGDLTKAVQTGFTAIDATPDWYKALVVLIFVDTFAFRRLLQNVLQSQLGKVTGKLLK